MENTKNQKNSVYKLWKIPVAPANHMVKVKKIYEYYNNLLIVLEHHHSAISIYEKNTDRLVFVRTAVQQTPLFLLSFIHKKIHNTLSCKQ